MADVINWQTVLVTLIVQIPLTLTALAAWRQGKTNARGIDDNTRVTAETKYQTDRILVKADEIHEQGNGTLSDLKGDLQLANEQLSLANRRIETLQGLVERLFLAAVERRGAAQEKKL